ncbi:DUF3097 domain-containing protein [Microbacterium sp. zg.B48]|uniref:DUF3097 domain-containing protein n=1 Tax=unclassified Microbacterium TaxID=2609290 RepID=UPI00214B3D71|nr:MULTISPECIES: DUF3097 domain-containing protein [unclassified Microbacterium]MCR2764703.1 DUF3097 domain-containing protein [Microbacterium sp. zg.B48]MCR2810160.1 DUF3097 domain-containing protein [Microbacterium sp. zg.B185]WIM20006.1 DUF3097 domain-containing protein [Microbacterium sp. zg-B185]
MDDRYAADVLAAGWRDTHRRPVPVLAAARDVVVEVAADGFCGAVVGVASGLVELEDRHGRRRLFPLGPGFLVDGADVVLTAPAVAAAPRTAKRTASGSFAAPEARARVARASRILVEGRHDAELVEKVWGADLRAEGVVVEYLQGVDLLAETLQNEPPTAERRYGVLVDHLVPGSKESRIADSVARGPHGRFVRIVGHPYVDVWQCVTPKAMGIARWPDVPRGTDIKVGTCRALGWPSDTPADLGMAWQRILARVHSYRDLDPALLGRVEELIDFVTD